MKLATYRSIGPFDGSNIPQGLLREHRLKDGSWGRLALQSGELRFVWDDDESSQVLREGDVLMVPPMRPHHLELAGDFALTIEFQREI